MHPLQRNCWRVTDGSFCTLPRSCSPYCRACQVTGRLNREPAQLRGVTKEPDNIHVNPDARCNSSRRRCFSSVTHALRDTLRRHRKICPREEINRGTRMPLAPSYEMKTSKCSQQCHKKVLARKIPFSGGIRLSPGPTMAAQLKGLLPRTGWRDATQAWAFEPGLSLSLLRVPLASGVVWARP